MSLPPRKTGSCCCAPTTAAQAISNPHVRNRLMNTALSARRPGAHLHSYHGPARIEMQTRLTGMPVPRLANHFHHARDVDDAPESSGGGSAHGATLNSSRIPG